MLKINVLAVMLSPNGSGESILIRTKKTLKDLIVTSPELVKIIPVQPSPGLVSATDAYRLPPGSVFVAHSPTGRKWSAEISRNESHVFSVH